MSGIVAVGFDGSEGAQHALHWAAEEARLRSATLRVVKVWDYMDQPGKDFKPDYSDTDARRELDEAIAALGDAVAGVEVEPVTVNDLPARGLLEGARGADLLVVGSRGHGGFAGLRLGSVSTQVAHHATMPVVILPGEERTASS
jgi:nucleotide-binding universal stress UspA family protein